jgi:hypothetical protein
MLVCVVQVVVTVVPTQIATAKLEATPTYATFFMTVSTVVCCSSIVVDLAVVARASAAAANVDVVLGSECRVHGAFQGARIAMGLAVVALGLVRAVE